MSNNNEALEKVFGCIKAGKLQRSEGDHWKAASDFLEAELLLGDLAKGQPIENDEQEKIQRLYQDQSDEYIIHGRQELVEAMTFEFRNDKEQRALFCHSLSDDEARARTRLFTCLFSRELEPEIVVAPTTDDDEELDVEKQHASLEERLMQLNKDLPQGFKTSKERMQEINRGLNRLGLSLYTSDDDTPKKPLVEVTKSESQQVADIIAQAQDEVQMEALINPPTTTSDDNSVVSSSDNLSSEDAFDPARDDDYDDGSAHSDDCPKLQNVKAIQHQVAKAQAKLAELAALLETIHVTESGKEDESLDKHKADSNIAAFDPSYGKATLLDAKLSLNKALKAWKVSPS